MLSPRLKTILIGLGLFAAVILIALIIWWAFFLSPIPEGVNTDQGFFGRVLPDLAEQLRRSGNVNRGFANVPSANIGALPEPSAVANGDLTVATKLVPQDVGSLKLQAGQDLTYYDRQKGEFLQLRGDGTSTKLTESLFPGADKVDWAPDGNKAVLSFPDDSKIVYDFQKQQQVTLPREAEDFSFSPDSQALTFKFLGRDPDDHWLALSNTDGTGTKFIEPLGDRDQLVDVDWSPNRQVVATYAKGANSSQQEIIFVGTQGENFPSTVVDGTGFQGKWSRDGQTLLYTVRSNLTQDNPSLWVMDGRPDSLGQRQLNLDVATFVDKCAFGGDGNTLFCAVPRYLEPGSGFFPELAKSSPDDFYQIDIQTGAQRLIAQPTDASGVETYSATDVTVSYDGRLLYFRDQRTNAIHRVLLK